jgi:pantoate--beta-alanine ligase
MQVETAIQGVRRLTAQWRRSGQRLAFVPTMGNLHEGHLALVRQARERADRVAVSIFVNPLQFGPGEDLDAYPRTEGEDMRKLEAEGVDLLFLPSEREMYPRGRAGVTYVEVPSVSDILCGAGRPGHFRGVATVVSKLFNIVQPDVAVFGRKDFQQLVVIRRLVEDLCFPVEVVGAPTVREDSGLAMSSRNAYLTADERRQAAALYRTLREIDGRIKSGERNFGELEALGMSLLSKAGFAPEYVSIRQAEDLGSPGRDCAALVALAAARLGRARLIDNLLIDLS